MEHARPGFEPDGDAMKTVAPLGKINEVKRELENAPKNTPGFVVSDTQAEAIGAHCGLVPSLPVLCSAKQELFIFIYIIELFKLLILGQMQGWDLATGALSPIHTGVTLQSGRLTVQWASVRVVPCFYE